MNPMHPFRTIEPAAGQLEQLCTRLRTEQHIEVEAYVDDQHRVCVCPRSELTTPQRVTVIVAVRACCSAPVRWEVA